MSFSRGFYIISFIQLLLNDWNHLNEMDIQLKYIGVVDMFKTIVQGRYGLSFSLIGPYN